MKRAHLKPAAGGILRHPQTLRKLAEVGEVVDFDRFWQRRVRAGDAVLERIVPDGEVEELRNRLALRQAELDLERAREAAADEDEAPTPKRARRAPKITDTPSEG